MFPKDTKALVKTAEKYNVHLNVVKSVIHSNDARSNLIANKILKIIKKPKGKKIGFLGVTFKANTDDMRDSSCLSIIPKLINKKCKINYYDPTGRKDIFEKNKSILFYNNIDSVIKNSDLVVIHTEWDEFKSLQFDKFRKKEKIIIFDLRNLYHPDDFINKKIKYFSIGRPQNV